MTSAVERTLAVLEYLSTCPQGVPLVAVAEALKLPHGACHRLLADLVQGGYLRQRRGHGDYLLTTKLAALGLSYLSSSGIVDLTQPLLDQLAQESGDLVRLGIVDGDRLTFVAKAQGARYGLRYDPDMGIDVRLSCSAAGHAWLATLSDERALALIVQQGFGDPQEFGPLAPTSFHEVLAHLARARTQGFSMISDVYANGMAAMAAPIRWQGGPTVGVVSIAGPMMRLTEARMLALGPRLIAIAAELGTVSRASPLFDKDPPPAAAVPAATSAP